MDLTPTIVPKSDQLNADDLITGPLTIRITAVKSGDKEQPVIINYEGDNGHPYKPGKSMRRVLVMLWGKDGAAYVGQSLTLYRDPTIRFGKDAVGGIRISHATGITEPMEVALTVTRGQRKPFVVEPLTVKPADESFDLATLTDVGASKAREGVDALAAWWKTIPKAAQKALKPTLDAEWKPTAESVAKN
jgi:hypothetical protein